MDYRWQMTTLNEVTIEKKRGKMSTLNDESAAAAAASGAQAMQVTLECWAKFGLDARRIGLDSQAARIAESQDTSVRTRRELTEQTKVKRKK